MATEYTPNYGLDLYVSADKPNLRDQYNAAMRKVDAQMKTNANNTVMAVTTANAAKAAADAMQGEVDDAKKAAESAKQAANVADANANAAKQAASAAQATADGKAPISHASSATTYGIGTGVSYGHVRLTNDINPSQTITDGFAVTPKAVYDYVDAHSGGGGTTGDYAPTMHRSGLSTYGVGDGSFYGHVKLTDSAAATADSSKGAAATPKLVHSAVDALGASLGKWELVLNKQEAVFSNNGVTANVSVFVAVNSMIKIGYVMAHLNSSSGATGGSTGAYMQIGTIPAGVRPQYSIGTTMLYEHVGTDANPDIHAINVLIGSGGDVQIAFTAAKTAYVYGANIRDMLIYHFA